MASGGGGARRRGKAREARHGEGRTLSSARSMDPEPSESKRSKASWISAICSSSSSNFLSAPSKHDDSCLRRRRRCLCAGGLTGTCPGMVACIPAPVLADAAAEHKNLERCGADVVGIPTRIFSMYASRRQDDHAAVG